MALKERKQITGTTAQIDAYAGHEGQILWDKEKKTLVGMSGTAGKNYPLATQEYADNKVSDLEGKVDTANAATNEALNKKENAGVCLPLVGGIMKGGILFNNVAGVWQNTSPEYDEMLVYMHDQVKNWQGGMLSCRGHRGSKEEERGSFALGARLKDGSGGSYLLGTTAGGLYWVGNEVLRITGAGTGWIRFNPNLQICFGQGRTASNGGLTVTFGAPFSDVVSVTSTILGGSSAAGANWSSLSELVDGTHFTAWTFGNGALQPNIGFTWCAFGYY